MKNTILIVDDRPENIYSLEMMLTREDRVILKANSGEEALKIAFQHELALILLDVQMPLMDGFEVARMLKSTKKTKRIPVIFVTAISKEKKYMLQGFGEGAVDYLFKPLDMEITRAKVDTLLQFYNQQKELEEKNIQLAKLNEEKNYFLGVASHDLRNPVGNMITLAGFVRQEAEDLLQPEHVEYLDIIISSGQQVIEMMNTLLDVSRIESGGMNLDLNNVSVIDLIQQVIDENKPAADRKSILLHYSVSDNMPVVSMDKSQVRQVLNNLISNAIKFCFNNKAIEITAELRMGTIYFSVIDQGQGIPENELPDLFQPLKKISVKSTNGEKSTGLGLTIVKKVVEAHGGELTVKSKVGEGSVFSFSIPAVLQQA